MSPPRSRCLIGEESARPGREQYEGLGATSNNNRKPGGVVMMRDSRDGGMRVPVEKLGGFRLLASVMQLHGGQKC
jgi:hypothetical protein